MDTSKHNEFFDPSDFDDEIHIIGVGAVGSHIAEQLARIGITSEIYLYDFDEVSAHNIPNQMFVHNDIGDEKVDAMCNHMMDINPDMDITLFPRGYSDQALSGHIFICADDMEICKAIVKGNQYNTRIKAMYDCRLRLEDAQAYAADWSNEQEVTNFIASMDFTNTEAKDSTPVSACNVVQAIIPTIRIATAVCIGNFINYTKKRKMAQATVADAFQPIIIEL